MGTTWPSLRRFGRDRGSGTLEYVGVVALSAVLVVAAVTATGNAAPLAAKVQCSIASVTGLGSCPSVDAVATTAAPATDPTGDTSVDPDRRGTERDARDSRRDDIRPGDDDPSAPKPGGTTGGDPYSGGVGDPVPGTTVSLPDPPAWTPPDAGAGEHGSEDAGASDHALKLAVESAANAVAGAWPHASRNLLHFLDNSGDPMTQDVDAMLSDVPGLKQTTSENLQLLVAQAIQKAQSAGATGPVTMPVSTAWTGYYITKDQSADWFYALGGIQWNQTGQVTVYPPKAPGEPWTYATTTQVNIRDRYNWDGTKATQIGPLTITDETLAGLHRKGLAQEFTATGSSSTTTTKGDAP